MTQSSRTTTTLLGAIAVVVLGGVLYVAQAVLLPLVLAAFLSVMVGPVLRRLNRRMPPWASLTVVLMGMAALLIGGTTLFAVSLYQVGARIPNYVARFEGRLDGLVELAQSYGVELTWDQIGTEKTASFAVEFLGSGLGSVANVIGQMVVVLFLMVFMIGEARQFERKIAAAFSSETRDKIGVSATHIVEQIEIYVMTKTLISLLTGFCTWIVCLVLGVDFAFFWGVLAFVLNFIPNVGSIIAVIPPVLIALLQFGTLGMTVLVLALLVTVQMLIGNVLEPRLLGRSMSLSTLVVFLSMLFWGWLWGIVGVVLAVPLTVAAKIICSHIEALRPVAVLLGGEPAEMPPAAQGPQPASAPDKAKPAKRKKR